MAKLPFSQHKNMLCILKVHLRYTNINTTRVFIIKRPPSPDFSVSIKHEKKPHHTDTTCVLSY